MTQTIFTSKYLRITEYLRKDSNFIFKMIVFNDIYSIDQILSEINFIRNVTPGSSIVVFDASSRLSTGTATLEIWLWPLIYRG